jgi:hypothetical protein
MKLEHLKIWCIRNERKLLSRNWSKRMAFWKISSDDFMFLSTYIQIKFLKIDWFTLRNKRLYYLKGKINIQTWLEKLRLKNFETNKVRYR